MEFLTRGQIGAISAFRPKEVEYVIVDKAFGNPGCIEVTFWLCNGSHVALMITPEGELKYV